MKSTLGNFEKRPSSRSSPGEFGKPVYAKEEEKDQERKMIREFGFNMFVSDKISLDREPRDMRESE